MKDAAHYESILRQRLAELNTRLRTLETELDQPGNPDAEERASERETDETLEGLGNAGLLEIRLIEAALGRIADRSFGTCVDCKEPISEERLDLVPHTVKCRYCAGAAEPS